MKLDNLLGYTLMTFSVPLNEVNTHILAFLSIIKVPLFSSWMLSWGRSWLILHWMWIARDWNVTRPVCIWNLIRKVPSFRWGLVVILTLGSGSVKQIFLSLNVKLAWDFLVSLFLGLFGVLLTIAPIVLFSFSIDWVQNFEVLKVKVCWVVRMITAFLLLLPSFVNVKRRFKRGNLFCFSLSFSRGFRGDLLFDLQVLSLLAYLPIELPQIYSSFLFLFHISKHILNLPFNKLELENFWVVLSNLRLLEYLLVDCTRIKTAILLFSKWTFHLRVFRFVNLFEFQTPSFTIVSQ